MKTLKYRPKWEFNILIAMFRLEAPTSGRRTKVQFMEAQFSGITWTVSLSNSNFQGVNELNTTCFKAVLNHLNNRCLWYLFHVKIFFLYHRLWLLMFSGDLPQRVQGTWPNTHTTEHFLYLCVIRWQTIKQTMGTKSTISRSEYALLCSVFLAVMSKIKRAGSCPISN